MNTEQEFTRGVLFFNQRRFFEAHDVWEHLWMETSGPGRVFFKGLIQAAVAYYHATNHNAKGAAHLMYRSIEKLEAFRPSEQGIDLEHVLPVLRHHAAAFDEAIPTGELILPSDIPLLGEFH